MTKAQRIKWYISKLEPLTHGTDCEYTHEAADELLVNLLCELGYSEVTDVYTNVCKWYA